MGLSFFLRGRKLYAIGTKQLQLGDKRVLLSVLWQFHYWTLGHWWQNLPKIDIIKRFLELGKSILNNVKIGEMLYLNAVPSVLSEIITKDN